MKYPVIASFLLCLILFSCKKDTVKARTTNCYPGTESLYPNDRGDASFCTTSICADYFDIWKEIVLEKNNLDQAFFDEHIEPHYSNIQDWVRGSSFNVCYYVKVDWAQTYACDKFIININPDDATYPALDLPRDVNLSKEEIKLVVDNRAFSSSITKISNSINELEYLSFEDALQDLIEYANVDTLCFTQLSLNKDNGNLILKTLAEYTNEENACVRGEVDLISKEKTVLDNPCYF